MSLSTWSLILCLSLDSSALLRALQVRLPQSSVRTLAAVFGWDWCRVPEQNKRVEATLLYEYFLDFTVSMCVWLS